MSGNLTDHEREQRDGELRDFLDFLDDLKPPLIVADSISAVLRTEPPIHFGVPRVVEVVAAWAERKAFETGRRVGEHMLDATRRIVDAYRSNTVTDFDPKTFYRPFVLGLVARCPADEREEFHTALKHLQESIPQRWANRSTADLAQADTFEVRGQRFKRDQAVFELARWIESDPHMTDEEFETALASLQLILGSRISLQFRKAFVRLAEAGCAIFNAGRTERAARLFGALAIATDHLQLTPNERDDVRNAVHANQLDARLFGKLVADPSRYTELLPVINYFAELDPDCTIDNLESEPSRERRRLLLNLVEVHGAAALPTVLERLTEEAAAAGPWYLARNLIFLLSRIEPPSEADRREFLKRISPYLTSNVPQLRAASVATLKRLGGRDVVPFIMKTLDPAPYKGMLDRAAVERHIAQVIEVLATHELESAVAIAAEFAVGTRGAEYGAGKGLRDAAIDALGTRTTPMPRRAVLVISGYLKQQAGRKLRLLVGALGVDLVACRRLVRLIADSTEPEAREVLATPFARKLATKGTSELIGGTAFDE